MFHLSAVVIQLPLSGYLWNSPTYMVNASEIWRRLPLQTVARALALALHKAGNNTPDRSTIVPMTTASSIIVNPGLPFLCESGFMMLSPLATGNCSEDYEKC